MVRIEGATGLDAAPLIRFDNGSREDGGEGLHRALLVDDGNGIALLPLIQTLQLPLAQVDEDCSQNRHKDD